MAPADYLLQLQYGPAAPHVLNCDQPRYLAALLRVARIQDVSVPERNVAAATAYIIAQEPSLTQAFSYADDDSLAWSDLVSGLVGSAAALALFRDCCQVAWADGRLDSDEAHTLSQLADALQLDAGVRVQISSAVATQARARLQLLELFGAASA